MSDGARACGQLLTHWLLYESVHRQMEAFREGFESVFPLDNLGMFFPEEIDSLFCGSQVREREREGGGSS